MRIENDRMLSSRHVDLPEHHRRRAGEREQPGIDTAFPQPFEEYVGNDQVINYVALRADEDRVGYISTKPNITAVYPFREDGLVKADVFRILNESGLGLPKYTEWGRTLHGDDAMFERLSLEGFQAGLAWITVLRKREAFRARECG